MKKIAAALIVAAMTLSGCTMQSKGSSDEEMKRYTLCVKSGGSYHSKDVFEWKCVMPEYVGVKGDPW